MSRPRASDPERDAATAAALLEEALEPALRRVRARLASRSGRDCPMRLEGVRPMTLGAALESEELEEASLWCRIGLPNGTVLVALESALLRLLMGRLFGEGDSQPWTSASRLPTAVERSVGGRLARELLEVLLDDLSIRTTMSTPAVAPTSRIASDLPREDTVLHAAIRVESEGASARLFVAFPARLIAPTVGAAPVVVNRAPQFDRVLPVQVELIVELARLQLSLGRLESLAPGDELALGPVHEVQARVGGRTAFIGQPGTANGQRSYRVGRRVESLSSSIGADR